MSDAPPRCTPGREDCSEFPLLEGKHWQQERLHLGNSQLEACALALLRAKLGVMHVGCSHASRPSCVARTLFSRLQICRQVRLDISTSRASGRSRNGRTWIRCGRWIIHGAEVTQPACERRCRESWHRTFRLSSESSRSCAPRRQRLSWLVLPGCGWLLSECGWRPSLHYAHAAGWRMNSAPDCELNGRGSHPATFHALASGFWRRGSVQRSLVFRTPVFCPQQLFAFLRLPGCPAHWSGDLPAY